MFQVIKVLQNFNFCPTRTSPRSHFKNASVTCHSSYYILNAMLSKVLVEKSRFLYILSVVQPNYDYICMDKQKWNIL
jgi:hypothetical protein